ncbi:AMP-binding protein [Nonomuraea turkmeniaca]|nr:AMP-binding protein [Nonomuraea turkmeniaca]
MPYTVPDLLIEAANRHGTAPAVIDGGNVHTYQELTEQAHQHAGSLAARAAAGERVALLLPRDATTLALYFGAHLAGLVPVIVHDQLRPRQVAHIIGHAQAALTLTTARLKPLLRDCATDTPVLLPDQLTGPPLQQPVRVIDRDLAALAYTSGSTGAPKGVMLSHHNLVSGAVIVADYLDLTADDRTLALLPWSFDYGLNQVLATFAVGGTAVIQRSAFPPDICRTLLAADVTGLAGVPTLWAALTGHGSPFLREHYPHLRYLTNSGGPLPPPAISAIRAAHPHVDIYAMYGLTEAFRSTFLDPALINDKPGSVGKAIPNSAVDVLDAHGRRCPPQTTGEIVHRGPTVALGYWRDPEASARVFRPHPRLAAPHHETVVYSGDLGYIDPDGDLYITGRHDDMVKIRGIRTNPNEIESEIMASGLAAAVAAVIVSPTDTAAGPDRGIDEGTDGDTVPEGEPLTLVAVQARHPDLRLADLEAFCRSELPPHLRPHRITLIETMPTTPHGKVDRQLVRRLLTGAVPEPELQP